MSRPTISIRHLFIAASPEAVIKEVTDVSRWPKWAVHNVNSSRRIGEGTFEIETPRGRGRIIFRDVPAYGILDHEFIDPKEGRWIVPARASACGDGAVFTMTFAKPPMMTDEQFAAGMKLLDDELNHPRLLIEEGATNRPR